jgi:hypothetical protein
MERLRKIILPRTAFLHQESTKLMRLARFFHRSQVVIVSANNFTILDDNELAVVFFDQFSLICAVKIKFLFQWHMAAAVDWFSSTPGTMSPKRNGCQWAFSCSFWSDFIATSGGVSAEADHNLTPKPGQIRMLLTPLSQGNESRQKACRL